MAGIRVVITFNHASAEEAARMIADWKDMVSSVQQEPGCLQFEFYHCAEDASRVALLEAWDTYEHYDAHHRAQMERRANNQMPPWPAIAPTVEIYQRQSYLPIDGVWQPTEPEKRLTSVLFP